MLNVFSKLSLKFSLCYASSYQIITIDDHTESNLDQFYNLPF